MNKFKQRTNLADSLVQIITGDVLDLDNLRFMIQKADILYNMAGVVTLSSKPDEFAKVIALNGFYQGRNNAFDKRYGTGLGR